MHSKDAAIKAVLDFVKRVKSAGIRVREAFLFGSYAHGTPNPDSDIDVAIISPDFNGFRFDDLGKIAIYKIHSIPDLEVHTFSEPEFNIDNPFAREIIKTGLKIV